MYVMAGSRRLLPAPTWMDLSTRTRRSQTRARMGTTRSDSPPAAAGTPAPTYGGTRVCGRGCIRSAAGSAGRGFPWKWAAVAEYADGRPLV